MIGKQNRRVLCTPLLILINLTTCCFLSIGQKYHFERFSIENGLNQSQVFHIAQDNNNCLWISTMGGVNKFDGRNFLSFTGDNEMIRNANKEPLWNFHNRIWIGGEGGIVCYDGHTFTHFGFADKASSSVISQVQIDSAGNVWARAGHMLYRLVKGYLIPECISLPTDTVTAIRLDNNGIEYAVLYNKGLYYFSNNKWNSLPADLKLLKGIPIKYFVFDQYNNNRLYLISRNNAYTIEHTRLEPWEPTVLKQITQPLTCIIQNKQNFWIGTSAGAYQLNAHRLRYFDDTNGFTNSEVLCVFKDRDENIWFGTNGDGIYQFNENSYLTLDKSQGLTDPGVMAMCKDKNGTLLLGTTASGIKSFVDGRLKSLAIPGAETNEINCLHTCANSNILIGTGMGGLWQRGANKIDKIYPVAIDEKPVSFHSIAEDNLGTVWLATSFGCFYMKNNRLNHVPGVSGEYFTIVCVSPDTVVAGGMNGVTFMINGKGQECKDAQFLKGLAIMTLISSGNCMYVGTFQKGIFVWDLKNKTHTNYSTDNGLFSNSIYSLAIRNGILWAGTGRGINKFEIGKQDKLVPLQSPFSSLVVECNQSSICVDSAMVYIGTSRAVVICDANTPQRLYQVPVTVLGEVKTYLHKNPQDRSVTDSNAILQLPFGNSHITFTFHGIQLSNPSSVHFRYQLTGNGDTVAEVTQREYVDFPSLLPGKYSFRVKAFIPGVSEGKQVSYLFEVLPAFYQTLLFKIALLLFFLLLLVSFYKYKVFVDRQGQKHMERLRLAEQEAVRRRTAEDFHDDLGNKLTRINILSEVLDKKINKDEKEIKEIIHHIKSSALEIYAGTRDILWALNPENDHVSQVINFIGRFAGELFEHTDIVFELMGAVGDFDNLRMPVGYSRNITLIFQELLNNILRHSHASVVKMIINCSPVNTISMEVMDNGVGFDPERVTTGHGLKNIVNRVAKIHGALKILSSPGTGTSVKVIFKISK